MLLAAGASTSTPPFPRQVYSSGGTPPYGRSRPGSSASRSSESVPRGSWCVCTIAQSDAVHCPRTAPWQLGRGVVVLSAPVYFPLLLCLPPPSPPRCAFVGDKSGYDEYIEHSRRTHAILSNTELRR